MKLHRGPRTASDVAQTDSKPASQIEHDWAPGRILYFDGTIDKGGSRHTDIGIELDEADVAALIRAFLRHWDEERETCKLDLAEARRRAELLELAMRKIHSLSWKVSQAPSKLALSEAVRAIINHFDPVTWNPEAVGETPDLKWIDWDAI